jgi:hypothetical protein
VLSMSVMFPLIVVNGVIRPATSHRYGRSYRGCEQQ